MKNIDVRWIQRFQNFKKAFQRLSDALVLNNKRELSDLEKQGLIQSFEFTHELAWKTMKDFLEYQGNFDIKGSRDAIREAFKINLLERGDVWMQMIFTRNQASHTYDESILNEVSAVIIDEYYELFKKFSIKMEELLKSND